MSGLGGNAMRRRGSVPGRRWRAMTLLALVGCAVQAAWGDAPRIEGLGPHRLNENAAEPGVWKEAETVLPDFPKEENLLEFYVSAATSNRFFVDGATLSVGPDSVVRFTLLVKTSGGATNTTFEGIRCATRERRLYATGRSDGTWLKARISEWLPIENKTVNRQHAALSREIFCPRGGIIKTADEGRDALRRGRHPNAD